MEATTTPDLTHIVEPLRPLAIKMAELVEDPFNARKHDDHNVAATAASLRRFGQRKPIVVNRNGMVIEAGNGTLRAAQSLSWPHIAAVLVSDDPVTATGYAIADNRTAELASWDDSVLPRLLADLRDEEMPLVDLGWPQKELDAMIGEVPAFGPASADEQGQLDQVQPKLCPHCGKDINAPPER